MAHIVNTDRFLQQCVSTSMDLTCCSFNSSTLHYYTVCLKKTSLLFWDNAVKETNLHNFGGTASRGIKRDTRKL